MATEPKYLTTSAGLTAVATDGEEEILYVRCHGIIYRGREEMHIKSRCV